MSQLILVVEDDDDNLSALSTLLVREGYRVLEARTGPDAIARARRERPDLILLDLAIPGINGLDVARVLKRDPHTAGVPIVALTGSWLGGARAMLYDAGFAGALRKPFAAAAFLEEVRRVLPAAVGLAEPRVDAAAPGQVSVRERRKR